jgi:hypothetical protein
MPEIKANAASRRLVPKVNAKKLPNCVLTKARDQAALERARILAGAMLWIMIVLSI